MNRGFFSICAVAASLLLTMPASPANIGTPSLTVTSGGLTFSSFTCSFTGTGLYAGNCSSLDVTALAPQPPGIQFSTDVAVLGVSSADAQLSFSVSAPCGINEIGLSFNTNFIGLDVNSVTEIAYTANGGTLVGQAVVSCGANSGCFSSTTAKVALSGVFSSLYITKDIHLSAIPTGPITNLAGQSLDSGGATTIISQTFTNTTVPEPVSISLVVGGLFLALLNRLVASWTPDKPT